MHKNLEHGKVWTAFGRGLAYSCVLGPDLQNFESLQVSKLQECLALSLENSIAALFYRRYNHLCVMISLFSTLMKQTQDRRKKDGDISQQVSYANI